MVPSSFTRKFLILLAFVVCVFYLAFRAIYTFNNADVYAYTFSVLLYVAECFGIFNLFLFFLQVWEVNEPPVQPVLEGRSVDIFVPTYNEDVPLLRATLEACVRMDYPHKTYVLDDGQRPEVAVLAKELGVHYITRPDNRHFKAGNLNHAFERTDGEFVVVLDADHVPEPHFITRLIGYFRDERLGFVQTPHAFYNFDSFQARLDHANRKYWEEGHLFYYVIQPGRNHWGCPIFAGSAAMFRRQAIRDVGLIATETITEDLHTGLRMNARGWTSLAITERLVAGQAAPDITTFHAQRLRWGTGNLSIMKYNNPLTTRGLTLVQRLCYLGSMLHWASGLFKLVIYLTPIVMLFWGVPPVKEFTRELLVITLVYLVVSLTTLKVISNGFGSLINSELFSMVNFWTQIKSTFRAIFGWGSRIFNVTPKGAAVTRGQKSVWPYIRPQTYLIIASVLALFWGWSRPALGISDDLFKPVVPTIWVLIHFWLAYKVTQRAFWPADRRFTTRHVVHVPVEYVTSSANSSDIRFGVTVDLNDSGMAFVAYERFNAGDILRFTVRGAGEVIKCKGEVRTVTDLTQAAQAEGFRYGILFQNLSAPQSDALNRICLHYGVPRLYQEYDRNRGGVLSSLKRWQDRNMSQRRSENRNAYHMPIVINSGSTEDTAQYSTTEDLSRGAVAAILDHDVPKNTTVGYLMATPLGDVRGTAKVLRSQAETYGGKTYHRAVLEFNEFEGQGRTTLNSLVTPNEARPLAAALKPDRKPILVRMAGPTIGAILIAGILIIFQSQIFSFLHRDDRILRDISRKAQVDPKSLDDADLANVNRILDETNRSQNPTTDRLVLLMNALKVYKRSQDQLDIAYKLASRNTNDLSLQQSLIYAQVKAKAFAEAESTYSGLLAKGDRLRPDERKTLTLAGARVAEGKGDLPLAIERYQLLYNDSPEYFPEEGQPGAVPLRREYAGVLIKSGRYDDAKKVLSTSAADDVEARRQLVAAYLLRGRAIANDPAIQDVKRKSEERAEYDEAERVIGNLVSIAERKGDKALKSTAERMKADVEMARASWKGAREIVEKLIESSGGDLAKADPDVVRRLAQVQLGLGEHVGATNGFSILLENDRVSGDERIAVIKGFLDSASYPDVLIGDRERKLALTIYDEWQERPTDDAVYLARLGWVLQRAKEADKSSITLLKASRMQPGNTNIREQLASILIETGDLQNAATVLAGSNAFRSKETLAGVYMKNGEYARAAEELRPITKSFPIGFKNEDGHVVTEADHRRVDLLLGNVMGLIALKPGAPPEAFGAASDYYTSLEKRYPDDREVPTAHGNVLLWSAERTKNGADYGEALKKFQKTLEKKNWSKDSDSPATRTRVEEGFIDAAASAPSMDAAQTAIARDIAAIRLKAPNIDPLRAARLSWVLVKSNDKEARLEAAELLRKALASNPTKDEVKRELAGALAAASQFKEAADILTRLKKGNADRLKLADLYAGGRQWDLAKKELLEVRADKSSKPEEVAAATRQLAKVTAWGKEHQESLKLIGEIINRDPEDVEMRIFQADVTLWDKQFDSAFDLFQILAKQFPNNPDVASGFINAAAKAKKPLNEEATGIIRRLTEAATAPDAKDALLAARLAEVYAVKLEDGTRAKQLAQKAIALNPKDSLARKEIGYVLAHPKIGLYKQADAMFSDLDLVGDERKQYVFIASQAENFEGARKQARLFLNEQLVGTPREREARRLLADVLTWKGDYEDALAIYERMLADSKDDRTLKVDIAEVHRFWQNYPTAFQKYAELLTEKFEAEKLWIGFIDAASSAPDRMVQQYKPLLIKVHDRYAPNLQDSRRISRLAWVMLRLSDSDRANALLNRAMAMNPQQPAVRKELAGVLAAADRRPEAIEMLTPPEVYQTLDIKEILNLADLLTAESQLELAEKRLAEIVTDKSEKRYRVRYASVLLWNGKYVKAQEIFARLLRDYPEDTEIPLRLAQSYLWSRDYPAALKRYTELLAAKPIPPSKEEPIGNPEIWRGYIDAASGTAGESLRELPRRNIGSLFTPIQKEAILKAYDYIPTVQNRLVLENKVEMDRFVDQAGEKNQSYENRRKAMQARHEAKLRALAESMGRLGLVLGLLGDRDRSSGAFGTALAIDKQNRDVWLQYAQTLTALGEDVKAKAVFDWLITAKSTATLPTPNEIGPGKNQQ